MNPQSVLAHLYQLLGRVVLLPIPKGQKGPRIKGWQNLSFEDTQTLQYQKKLQACQSSGGNIGALLGPASDNLQTVDVDDDELDGMFENDNPFLRTTLQTRGHRGRNFWFRPKPGTTFPNGQAVYPLKTKEGDPYGEFRCGGGEKGAQVVIFGLHPLGDIYQIANDAPPVEIDFAQIKWFGPVPGEEERIEGKSLIYYQNQSIDESRNLLGNRWLSRLCGALIISPSGHGKSSFSIQFAALVSCGRNAFAIHPPRPLRVLIIQAEDDENDLIEMASMINRLKLDSSEHRLIDQNTRCLWVNDVTGLNFITLLDKALATFPADLLLINPISAYVGRDLRDEEAVHEFFRVWLTPVLKKYNCGLLGIHHSPKTNFQHAENFNWYDWMYSGAGHATLTNWARGVIVIVPTDTPGTYRFIAAKRYEKTGWQDREYWYSHSSENDVMLWVPSTEDQIASGRKGKSAGTDALLTIIPMLDPVPEAQIILQAKIKFSLGRDKVRDFLKILEHEAKIFRHLFSRPRTNPEVKYARTPQSE